MLHQLVSRTIVETCKETLSYKFQSRNKSSNGGSLEMKELGHKMAYAGSRGRTRYGQAGGAALGCRIQKVCKYRGSTQHRLDTTSAWQAQSANTAAPTSLPPPEASKLLTYRGVWGGQRPCQGGIRGKVCPS